MEITGNLEMVKGFIVYRNVFGDDGRVREYYEDLYRVHANGLIEVCQGEKANFTYSQFNRPGAKWVKVDRLPDNREFCGNYPKL